MSLLIITHVLCLLHLKGIDHPESSERLVRITQRLKAEEFRDLQWTDALPIDKKLLTLAHNQAYLDKLFSIQLNRAHYIDSDTILTKGSIDAALLAAGSLIQAVDEVMTGNFKRVFCAIRPPGHHAESNRAMGFCFFNNVALGARYAQEKYGLNRIAIVDFDVHHGNGTEEILRNYNGFLYISTHGTPLYPGTGLEDIPDHVLNRPLLARTGSYAFKKTYEEDLLPKLEAFAPELIFISAGFDAHEDDPIGNMRLRTEDYEWITEKIVKIASKTAEGRVVSSLEGGYNLKALAESVAVHVKALKKDSAS